MKQRNWNLTWFSIKHSHGLMTVLFICCSLCGNATSTIQHHHAGSTVDGNINLTHVQYGRKHLILIDVKSTGLKQTQPVVNYRCLGLKAHFCNTKWMPLYYCEEVNNDRNISHDICSYICEIKDKLLPFDIFEVRAQLTMMNNLTNFRTLNFTVKYQGLAPTERLTGYPLSMYALRLGWQDSYLPDVVKDFDPNGVKKILQVLYWIKDSKDRKKIEEFHLKLYDSEVTLKRLYSFTSYSFKVRFKLQFGSLIPLSWTGWSETSTAKTYGVPAESVQNVTCEVVYNGTLTSGYFQWKFPPKATWNGILRRLKVTVLSRSHSRTWLVSTKMCLLNCSQWFSQEFTLSGKLISYIKATLCTDGGCGVTKVVQCTRTSRSRYRGPLMTPEVVTVVAVASLSILLFVTAVAVVLFKRYRVAKQPVTHFGDVDFIDPRANPYESGLHTWHVYAYITTSEETQS